MFRSGMLLFLLTSLTAGSYFAQESKQSAPVTQGPTVPREDWTKIKVDRSALTVMSSGISLGMAEFPSYTRELLRFEWRHGDFIDVYLIRPRSAPKPQVVLYLYSFPYDIDLFMDDGWCRRATREGVAAVGFVSALTGVRFRNRPMREWFVRELPESIGSTTHDVQLILDYLAARPDLSADQVGFVAQGSGATIAILAAAADPRIRALDLLNPWGDWPDWLKSSVIVPKDERAEYLTPEFLQGVSRIDPVAYLPQLTNRALRLQQIMDSPDIPAAARDSIAAATPQGDLFQYKDRAAHLEAMRKASQSWIVSQIMPQPQPPVAGAGAGVGVPKPE